MNSITIENAHIIYRNFSGKEGRYNPKGRRNFSVILEEDIAMKLQADGWKVKPLKKRDENDPSEPKRYHLPVAVVFGPYPPKIVRVQGKTKTILDQDNVNELDWADLSNIDLIIKPREWEKGRIKAYLRCGYFTIEENELDRKYADPDDEDEDLPF